MKQVFPLLCLSLIYSGFCVHAWGAPPQVASSTSGITLQECFERAHKISETVGISAENTRLVQQEYRAQIGAVLPHIDWIKSQFYQQNTGAGGGSGSAANTYLLATQPLSYFQLTQPIFAGFRDWEAIAITKSQKEQARLNEQATDLQLLTDVATAFYAAYTLQDQLSVLKETRKLNQDQVDQLDRWVNIGRSRPSDLLSAQTQLASIDAQIEDTRRTWAESRHLLLFLAGVPAEVPLTDEEPTPPGLTLEEVITRASKRPDILSAVESLHQAELTIQYQRGGHLPTLSLTAHSYTERIGFLSDVRWDATFLLDVPLYEGGSTQAQVRQARSQEIIAQLTLARLTRDVDRQVRTAYEDLQHAVSEVQAYDKAVQLAEKNYGVQQKENRLGVTTNLELLQLLTNMQNIRGQALISRATARLDDILLRVAMGEGL
jgi:outer membrane protein